MERYATFKSNINNEYEHLPYNINTKIIEGIEQLQRTHNGIDLDKLNIVSGCNRTSYHKIYIEYNHDRYLINKEPYKKLVIDTGMLNKLVRKNFNIIVSYMVGGKNANYDG